MDQKLIIIEGTDGIGKTTQVKKIADAYSANILSQPNGNNIVGNLRDICKMDKSLLPLERQLFMAISQIVDAYETIGESDGNLVMDRSYLSGIVYGGLTLLRPSSVDLLFSVLSRVHDNVLLKFASFSSVHIIILHGKSRFDKPDLDVFELNLKWNDINESYMKLKDRFAGTHAFCPHESWHLIDISNKTENQNFKRIVEAIEFGAYKI